LESYRNPQGQPRHRVVISLGDAPLAPEDWKAVAAVVADQLYGQTPLAPATLSDRARQYVDSITRRVLREGRWLPLRPAVIDPQAQSLDGVLVDQVKLTAGRRQWLISPSHLRCTVMTGIGANQQFLAGPPAQTGCSRPHRMSWRNRSLLELQTHDTTNFASCLMLANPQSRHQLSGRTQTLGRPSGRSGPAAHHC
jgi:hypothetical protein